MTEFIGELFGTAILIIFGAGVCANTSLNKSYAKDAGWIVVALGWGLAVTLAIYAVGNISGAHLNPAVTLGLALSGTFAWNMVIPYIIAQLIGAMLGASIIYLQFLPHWKETKDAGTKLGIFATGPAIKHTFSNVISEVLGTAVLMLALLYIGTNKFVDGLNPLVVGALIVAIGLSLGGTTGYAINPARDFGPRLAHAILPIAGKGSSNWGYAWIPIVGPFVGSALAVVIYSPIYKHEWSPYTLPIVAVAVILLVISFVMTKKQA